MMAYRPAAAVVPYRENEVLGGLRGFSARSFQGYFVFPGGNVEAEDASLPLLKPPLLTHWETTRDHLACALRELGEETGRYVLAQPNGDAPTQDQLKSFKKSLSGENDLEVTLEKTGLVLDGRSLAFVGAVQSPDYGALRFEVHQFFLKACPEPLYQPMDELTHIQWRNIDEIHDAWSAGKIYYLPPILRVMRAMQHAKNDGGIESAIANLRDNPSNPIESREVIEGLRIQAYRTPTLPPAENTNTFFLGTDKLVVVDPATPEPGEQERFDALIKRLLAEGKKLDAIILSHHHADHVGDTQRAAEKWSLPIWGHPLTAEKLAMQFDRELDEGDEIHGWQVLHTPGHAVGHLSFWHPHKRALVAADMVAEESTIIIEPHDGGCLKTYMASLERLIALKPRSLVPSHGHLRTDGDALLVQTLEHRQKRVTQIKGKLMMHDEPQSPRQLVEAIYAGEVPEAVYPLAEMSVLSTLLYLQDSGAVTQEKKGWRLKPLHHNGQ